MGVAAILFTTGLLLAPPAHSATATGTIKGTVRDADTGEPLPSEARIPEGPDDPCIATECWLANGGQYGNRSTRITKTEAGFEVEFLLHTNNHGEGQLGQWQYLVRWDRVVEPR